jgi:hypothetical protein
MELKEDCLVDAEPKVIDKTGWPNGPWMTEPDRKEWRRAGFPCLIRRVSHSGALCGYVAVPPGHPWHGKSYDDIEADVHGGLTYAAACRGDICHVPAPGEPDDVWWLGFDHAHAWDRMPGTEARNPNLGAFDGSVYRDMTFVTAGVEALADQAAVAK